MHSALLSTARYTSSANHPSPSTASGQEVKTAEAEAKKAADAKVAETNTDAPKGAKAGELKKKGGSLGRDLQVRSLPL